MTANQWSPITVDRMVARSTSPKRALDAAKEHARRSIPARCAR